MTIIEQIKAEIERLKGQLIRGACAAQIEMETNCKEEAYDEILSFLSTLESEKPMNQKELEEEIQRFLSNATKMDKGEWKGKYPISEMGFGVVARHFYDLGCRRTAEKYDDIEYNRQKAEERLADARKTSPSDLEEAARRYGFEEYRRRCNGGEYGTSEDAFIAGAKWHKEQMMKEAVEAHIYQSANPVSEIGHQLHQAALLYEDKENAPYLKAGDKVHIIIVKED